jgi:hypothetical protein
MHYRTLAQHLGPAPPPARGPPPPPPAFSDAVARLLPGDALLGKMLQSSHAAVEDPADELVHLYEIREALQRHFGGERKAKAALGLTDAMWKPLGRLACDEPVRQGRHRGAHLEELREATPGELKQARKIARELIEAYVRWAEGCEHATERRVQERFSTGATPAARSAKRSTSE